MNRRLFALPLAGLMMLGLAAVAGPAEAKKKHPWIKYEAKKYGFSMKVPKGTRFKDKAWKDGWAGLYANNAEKLHPAVSGEAFHALSTSETKSNYWSVQLWGLTHKGVKHTVPQFQVFGVLVTGIPGKKWKLVEEGKDANGFKWFKVHQAEHGKYVVFALYGVGEKGSYMLVLKTTKKSFARDKDQYLRWYRSIHAS